jgi:hypothetical protein
MITELKNPLTEDYKNLKNLVTGNNFPWHYLEKTVPTADGDDMSMFYHCLLGRPAHEINGEKVPALPRSASSYFEYCYFIFKDILDFNNIDFEVMYRMNINLTLHSKLKESIPHVDTSLQHKVVIVYLNEFTKGRTVVLGEDEQKFYSNPKEDNVIMFDGKHTHYQECPGKHEKRIVMVANFQ